MLEWSNYFKQLNRARLSFLGAFVFPILIGYTESFVGSEYQKIFEWTLIPLFLAYIVFVYFPVTAKLKRILCPNCKQPFHSRDLLNYPFLSKRCSHCQTKIGASESIKKEAI